MTRRRSCRVRPGILWEVLLTAYQILGLDPSCGRDEVFILLTLARVIEPTSKLDSIRVLTEVGIAAPSYPTIKRRLSVYATPQWRDALASVCGACRVGPGDVGALRRHHVVLRDR